MPTISTSCGMLLRWSFDITFMIPSLRPLFLFIFLISTASTFSQSNNSKPEIVGQSPSPLKTLRNQPITIKLSNLIIRDDDPLPVYPDGFTLDVDNGDDYDVDDATVTPDRNFTGTLRVPVRVDDGRNKSKRFDVRIEVTASNNIAPVITGQESLTISQGQNFTVELSHLKVQDPDNNYPQDFTLKVLNGNNYSRSGNRITPFSNFTGSLKVPVTVNDGQNESKSFDLKIDVVKAQNVAPQITGQENLETNEDSDITLQLSDLKVTDTDDSYPKDFQLKITAGPNYTVSGSRITPAKDFSGILSVAVNVNDGENDSAPFNLQLTVKPVNDAPIITGQSPLSTNKNTSIPIELSYLKVTDPDDKYPDDFTLKISNGANYSVAGKNVNPLSTFTGMLNVSVTVNDGDANSAAYTLKINVVPPANIPPSITGQKEISITQNTQLPLLLGHLLVTDPDNVYPNGFTLKVGSGNNYSVEGTTIRPLPNFTNTLTVSVKVNDGKDDSAPFNLKIQVVPISATPKINGQKEITMLEDSTIAIRFQDLEVTDADSPGYPKGFSLTVLPGNPNVYSVADNKIRPASNLNGFIEVSVIVNDGGRSSEPFKLSVLVTPVNDPPEIIDLETTPLAYEPGEKPKNISEAFDLRDVDSDYLSMAEIGFWPKNYSQLNDKLIINNDSSKIRAIYDREGILFLVGYATIDEYRTAIRSIQYNYEMTEDENGNPSEILSGTRTIYFNVHDGQDLSETHERQITMETKVLLDIPNAFTPNGDSSNDTWRVHAPNKDQLDKAIIRVYNKRGVLLYESIGYDKDWDGLSNGEVLPVDTYYYTIDLNLSYLKKTYKGVVTILH